MNSRLSRQAAEERFGELFEHLGLVIAYARRRGGSDPEAIAAEVMAIAWRRLLAVPAGDARPWLIATARNLLIAGWRRDTHERSAIGQLKLPEATPSPSLGLDDPALQSARATPAFLQRQRGAHPGRVGRAHARGVGTKSRNVADRLPGSSASCAPASAARPR